MTRRIQVTLYILAFALVAALVAAAALWADTSASEANNPPTSVLSTVMIDPLEPQPDNDETTDDETPVKALLEANGRYYVGGDFLEVGGEPRRSIAAIEVATGQLDPDFAPLLTGSDEAVYALAISPDGNDLYVGGKFTKVDGTTSNRLAKLDAHTGVLDTAFSANANAVVESIATDGTSVWIGGNFTTVSGISAPYLTKLNASTGAVDPAWTGATDGAVLDIELSGTALWVGGNFLNIAGTTTEYLAPLDAATGALSPQWAPTYPEHQKVMALSPSPDGSTIYVGTAGTPSESGNAVRAYASDGTVLWQRIGAGDVQAIEATATTVYGGTHGQYQYEIAKFNLDGTPNDGSANDSDLTDTPFPTNGYVENDTTNSNAIRREKFFSLDAVTGDILAWNPDSNSTDGVWELESGPSGLLSGGDFRNIYNPTGAAGGSGVFVPHFAVFAGLGNGGNAAPEPLFTVDCAGTACNFDGSSSLDDGSIASYEWTLPGLPPATGVAASAVLQDNTTHDVTLTVTDNLGLSASRTQRVVVGNGGLPVTPIGTDTVSGSNNKFTVALPTNAQAGDVSVAFMSVSGSATVATAPAGWVAAGDSTDGSLRTFVFWRSLGANEVGANVTFETAPGGKGNLTVTTLRGVDGTTPIAAIGSVATPDNRAEHATQALSFTGDATVLHYWAERTSNTTELAASPELSTMSTEIGMGGGRVNATLALDPQLRTDSSPAKVAVTEHHGPTALGWAIALTSGSPVIPDTEPPSSTIDPLTAAAGPVTITGTATDTESPIAAVRVRIKRLADNTYWNGTTWVTTANTWPTATGTNTWSSTLTLDPGNYAITAYATDTAGNVQGWNDNRPFQTITIN